MDPHRFFGPVGMICLALSLLLAAPATASNGARNADFAGFKSSYERMRTNKFNLFREDMARIDARDIPEYQREEQRNNLYEQFRTELKAFEKDKRSSYKTWFADANLSDDQFREEILRTYEGDNQAREPIGEYIREAGHLKRSAKIEQDAISEQIRTAPTSELKRQRKQELADSKARYAKKLAEAKDKLIDRLVDQQMDRALVSDYAGKPEAQAMVREYIRTRPANEEKFEKELTEEYGEEDSYSKKERRKEQEWRRQSAWKELQEKLRPYLASTKKAEKKVGLAPGARPGFGAYAEGYLAYAGNSSSSINPAFNTCQGLQTANFRGTMDPGVAGGVRLGLWFERGGLFGQSLPTWAQYFGIYTDFSYHRLNFAQQGHGNGDTSPATFFSSEGTAATWSFMFAGRYGFLPDQEVPFGRLQPYVGVGPGILFTSQNPIFSVTPCGGVPERFEPGSQSSAVVCLTVDAGLRYMALSNVFIDVFFKYRRAQPSFTYDTVDPHNGLRSSVTLSPTLDLFSANVGVGILF
jgi:outer membrane protein W